MESPETESGSDPTKQAEGAESTSTPDRTGVDVGASDGSSGATSADAPSAEQRSNRRDMNPSGERKGQRGRRPRRRGRRRRRPRDRDQDSRTEAELMAELPDDQGELMALSRPLGLLEVLGSGSGFIRRRESG